MDRINTEQFGQKIKHLDQIQILNGAVNALWQLLISKNILKGEELRQCFLNWVKDHDLEEK